MNLNINQQNKLNQLKTDYKKFKVDEKKKLKEQLNSSGTYKFEKPIIKDDFKIKMFEAKKEFKRNVIHIKKPDFFKKDNAQREAEKQIFDLQTSYYKGLTKCEKQIRRAKRINWKDKSLRAERKEKIQTAKINLKTYKETEKVKLKNEKEKIKLNQQVNKARQFQNTTKILGNRAMDKIIPAANKFANQKHLLALRNSFMSTLPLGIVGALVMIVGTIPVGINIDKNGIESLYTVMAWITDQNQQLGNGLAALQQIALGIMALGIAFAAGLDLGESYGETPLVSGIMGLFGFVMWLAIPAGNIDLGTGSSGWSSYFPTGQLGGSGIFAALISSMVMLELYRIFKKHNITIRLPKQVPPAIANSFVAFIPCMIYILFVWGLKYGAGFDFINVFSGLSGSMTAGLVNSLGWACLIAIIPSMSWWVGIHGGTFLIFFSPAWVIAMQQNQMWVLEGMQGTAPNLYVDTFFNALCWMGGGGGIIGLAIAGLIFSKSRQNKAISRAAFVPAVFNISEPIMFGYPVVLNIYFLIPFILAPLGTVLIATPLMAWLGVKFVAPPQQLPSFILGLICTGNNWKGIIVALIIAGFDTLVYAPFFIAFDRVKLAEEKEAIAKEAKELGISIRELLIQQEQGKIKKTKKQGIISRAMNKKKANTKNV